MVGKFLRGALIEFLPTMLVPIPNIVIFQFNPETMTHTWTPAHPAPSTGSGGTGGNADSNPLAVSGTPGEAFSFTLTMDSNDMLADGSVVAQGIAETTGIYTRLAALEMLLYPTGASGLDALVGAVSSALSGGSLATVKRNVPPSPLPTVLFVWGPGRILPVKVTTLTITEKLYDPILLNPIHADAQIGLQVLTPEELGFVTGPLADVAKVAYTFNQGLREALAILNLANAVESAIGMLPV